MANQKTHQSQGWRKLSQLTTGLLILISIIGFSNVPEKNQMGAFQQNLVQRPGGTDPNDSTIVPLKNDVTIRGKITRKSGEPLGDVDVSWNGQQVLKTSADGTFEFLLGTAFSLKAGVIRFSYPELVPVVRTYHPSMGNIDYDLALCPPTRCRVVCFDTVYFETPVIQFAQKSIELTDDHRTNLAVLAEKLRNNPEVHIELTTGASSHPEIRRSKYMYAIVRNWLVDNEGISEDRIHINQSLGYPHLLKIVEIKATAKE